MDIEWDPRKAAENLQKYGVDFADAVIALEDESALTIEDTDYDGQRFKTLEMGPGIKVLYVIHTYRENDRVRIISAEKLIVAKPNSITEVQFMSEDFSKGKRGAIIKPDPNKVRITIRLDGDIIEHFKDQVQTRSNSHPFFRVLVILDLSQILFSQICTEDEI